MMRRAARAVVTVMAAAGLAFLGSGVAHAAIVLDEDFSTETVGTTYAEGQNFASLTDVFNGFGYQKIVASGGAKLLEQSPQASTDPGETHASLSVTQQTFTPKVILAEGQTDAQLRTPTPNPWEVAWLTWNYTDTTHFYYLVLKPNGWELGKADPAYPGSQRFLATGSSPTYALNTWLRYRIEQTVNPDGSVTIVAKAKKPGQAIQTLATFTDTERPYTEGKVGLYNEDATARWGWLQVTT